MNGFSRDERARLLKLLGREIELMGQIYELTEKQTEVLAADDISAFDSLLDSRQELIEKINGLHQESDILMQSYLSSPDPLVGGKPGEIDEAVAERQDLFARCAALNEENAKAATEKAEGYIKRIGKLSMSRKSMELYAPGLPSQPEMIDKKT